MSGGRATLARLHPPRPQSLAAALVGVVLSVAGLALAPAAALADADPASDFLLVDPVFYPYQPPTSPALKKTLQATLAQIKAKGLNLKVAILDDATDLGGVTSLWNMPQPYADFLDREISFNTKQPLLVVMPAGFGVANAGPTGALNGMLVDSTHSADGLARSSILAAVRLARAAGTPVPTPAIPAVSGSGSKGGGGTSPALTFGAPVALVLIAAAVAALMRRRAHDDDDDIDELERS